MTPLVSPLAFIHDNIFIISMPLSLSLAIDAIAIFMLLLLLLLPLAGHYAFITP